MLKDPRSKLLQRYLVEGDIDQEIALLSALPAGKQEVVFNRLTEIDQFLNASDQSALAADAVAERIGVARRQFYKLLAKLKSVGPVRALSPGFRNVARSAPSKDGLDKPLEQAMRLFLKENPVARIADVAQHILITCERMNREGLSVSYPGETAIRRRVHVLRREGAIRPLLRPIGGRLVIDQIIIDLPATGVDGAKLCTLTVIVDPDTRIVCGASLTAGDGMGMGLMLALKSFRRVVHALVSNEHELASTLCELEWIVPPGLDRFSARARTNSDGISVKVVREGVRRHGRAIMRILGDRFGPYNLRLVPQPAANAPKSDRSGLDLLDANEVILPSLIDSWNRRFRDDNMPVGEGRGNPDILADQLEAVFAPVFGEVQRSQADAHSNAEFLRSQGFELPHYGDRSDSEER